MGHLLEGSFFPGNMATKTPFYLSLLLGFVKTGPANVEANKLDRQCSPLCLSLPKASWSETATSKSLFSQQAESAYTPTTAPLHSCATQTHTQSRKSHASNAILQVEGLKSHFLLLASPNHLQGQIYRMRCSK